MSSETLSAETCELSFRVDGMDCASCVAHVEKAIRKVPGVQRVAVNLALGRATVAFDPTDVTTDRIAAAATAVGYPTQPVLSTAPIEPREDSSKAWLRRGVLGVILWLPLEIVHMTHGHSHMTMIMPIDWLMLVASTLGIILIGGAFYRSAFAAARRLTSNMDTLISMGATVAYGYSLIAFVGFLTGAWSALPPLYFNEGTALLALISLGHWLEARARTRAGSAIHELMALTPQRALKLSDDRSTQEDVAVADLKIGDLVLVRPGDRVPIDGKVVSGRSSVDESMMSGEATPVTRGPGDEVIGGTLNNDGALVVRISRIGSETALAQIIRLVESAQNAKPPVQKLADAIAAVFVPSVLTLAVITGIGWLIYGHATHEAWPLIWAHAAQAVCGVLIVACPCALGLAVPAALMVGTGRGARLGILFRDISALQNAEKIDVIAFDKTGTITQGKPQVVRINVADGVTENDLLQLAASAEQFSSHPLAIAIVATAKARGLALSEPDNFSNEPGVGVHASIGGSNVFVGAVHDAANAAGTQVGITRDGVSLGSIQLNDAIKPSSAAAIAQLHAMRLGTMLITGDRASAAEAIAREAGIEQVEAGVKPGGKAQRVQTLQQNRRRVAMVGDGINDAPALAQADLGIAIGSGSDIAKETGDIVLVRGDLLAVPQAIRLSRATMRTIRLNLCFAFVYNVIAIPLAAFGFLSPIVCAAAMALSDVTVLGNSLLLHRKKL